MRSSLDSRPGCERHDAMVNHMQHWQVGELLPQQEEQGVKVVNELWEEVPPGHVQCIHAIIGIWNRSHSSIRDIILSLCEHLSSPQADRASCSGQSARSWPSWARSRGWAASAASYTQSESWWCHRAACPSWTWAQLFWKQADITPIQPLFYSIQLAWWCSSTRGRQRLWARVRTSGTNHQPWHHQLCLQGPHSMSSYLGSRSSTNK